MEPTPENPDKQPLMAHLVELRQRLTVALAAFFIATGVAYAFSNEIYGFLVRPLAASMTDDGGRHMIYTGLAEAFFTYIRLSMFAGFFIAFPVIAAQVYYFVAPGLYARERRMLVPYFVAAPALFLLGAALCYYVILPVAWGFFLSFESGGSAGGLPIRLEARVSEYLSLVTHMVLAFGVSFQLPVVLALMTQAGMVQAETLARGRRYAIVIIVAVAAVITPPDVFSQVALAAPLYVLYEASVWICRVIEKGKKNNA